MDETPGSTFTLDLISRLAPDPVKVAEWVSRVRGENPGLTDRELCDVVGDKIVWTYTSQGAALSLPGAVPGLGTIVQISAEVGIGSVDTALMIRNQAYLVSALGAVFNIQDRDVLIQDTLICIGLWTKALTLTKAGTVLIGTKIAEANFKSRFPASILQTINRKVGTTILTKYGTKRGGVAIGKLIPFGVGVLVGGGFNYLTMKAFKRRTIEYFEAKVE